MSYQICCSGCDDSTEFELDLDLAELTIILRLANRMNEVGGGCKPTMQIRHDETKEILAEYYDGLR